MGWHPQESYKGLLALSVEVVKTMTLLNGAAVIALLSFLGSRTPETRAMLDIVGIRFALSSFGLGLVAIGFAVVMGYVTQLLLYGESIRVSQGKTVTEWHAPFLWATLLLAALSVLSFALGFANAASAIAR